MPQMEFEHCYTGIVTPNGAMLHFFDGRDLIPVRAQRVFPCQLGWTHPIEAENTALSILTDYMGRHEGATRVRDLAPAFASQFLTGLTQVEVLFVEEYRVDDWLRVMHMLEVA